MRNILFRAKGLENERGGAWFEGYYYYRQDTTYCFSEDYERAAKEGKDVRHHYILFNEMTDWGLPDRHFQVDIKQETLCQFTGKYDCDRHKIFEHDYIQVVNIPDLIYEVVYSEERAAFMCKLKDGGAKLYYCDIHPVHIIGNTIDGIKEG